MESCRFIDFMKALTPWLDRDYIRKGYVDASGEFRIFFTDGGEKRYRIDDCSQDRIREVFEMMKRKGIPVERGV